MKINFITTEDINTTSGGWSGINSKLNEQLSKTFNVNYIGPVQPKSIPYEKFVSKVKRVLGLKGSFHNLSGNRLDLVKNEVLNQLDSTADYNFFFGQMPWTSCNFKQPYGVYLDACFPTYLEIYSTPEKFDSNDISRISTNEKKWLLNAKHLFFGSYWAMHQAEKHYKCEFHNAEVVWVGGNIPVPQEDKYDNGLNLLFISLNFEKKGGYICVEAFQKVREKYKDATLTIIGQQPPAPILAIEGIKYAGLLNKKNPKDFRKFIDILEKAFLLIHPTVMDTMGAVIIEAGYYGCPSIAPKSFGIPELIKDKETGIVVDTPFTAEDFSTPILYLLENKNIYLKLREKVKTFTSKSLTWRKIGECVNNKISDLSIY